MEQMSLMALADTIATTSTDLDSQGKSKGTTKESKQEKNVFELHRLRPFACPS